MAICGQCENTVESCICMRHSETYLENKKEQRKAQEKLQVLTDKKLDELLYIAAKERKWRGPTEAQLGEWKNYFLGHITPNTGDFSGTRTWTNDSNIYFTSRNDATGDMLSGGSTSV